MLNFPWPIPPAVAAVEPPPGLTVDQVLSPYVYVFYAAYAVAFGFTPVMRQVALHYNVVDAPDLKRKLHAGPIAYLGGVAMFLGWIAGLAISQRVAIHRADAGLPHVILPVRVVGAAAMIVGLGLWDDVFKVRARFKVLVQLLAAAVLLSSGIGNASVEPLLGPVLMRAQLYLGWNPSWLHWAVVVASWGLTMGLVVGCCNATNLMDGLDGLCGGVTGIVALGFTFLAVHMATYGDATTANADGLRVVLGLALLGGVLAFVPFNFNPASLFMGDAGSMFLGFSCATLIAMMAENRPRWFLAAMIMFSLPVLDTALAFVRRYVAGRPLFSADRHHIHHQLINRGFSVKQTVLISYAMAFAFVLLGAAIVFVRVRYAAALYLVIFGSIIVAAVKMGMVHERVRAVVHARRLGEAQSATAAEPAAEYDPEAVLEVGN